MTSIAPLLLIVVAIAGLVFGQDAAQGAITAQLTGLMGQQTAELLEQAVANASNKSSGLLASLVGVVTLIATASGAFGELQSALNAFWQAKPKGGTVSRLIRARAASMALCAQRSAAGFAQRAAHLAEQRFGLTGLLQEWPVPMLRRHHLR